MHNFKKYIYFLRKCTVTNDKSVFNYQVYSIKKIWKKITYGSINWELLQKSSVKHQKSQTLSFCMNLKIKFYFLQLATPKEKEGSIVNTV